MSTKPSTVRHNHPQIKAPPPCASQSSCIIIRHHHHHHATAIDRDRRPRDGANRTIHRPSSTSIHRSSRVARPKQKIRTGTSAAPVLCSTPVDRARAAHSAPLTWQKLWVHGEDRMRGLILLHSARVTLSRARVDDDGRTDRDAAGRRRRRSRCDDAVAHGDARSRGAWA